MPQFTVSKGNFINAPLDQVHAAVRDFRRWPNWSPWFVLEPDCEITFSEDGRRYAWHGRIVGQGEMEITREEAPRSIDFRLTFLKPWKSVSLVGFTFHAKDGGTETTWTMGGSLPFFMFWMKPMMTGFVGMDFQRGLTMLKDYVETGTVPSKLEFLGPQSFTGSRFVGIRRQCAMADIASSMGADFAALNGWFSARQLPPSDKPFAITHVWDFKRGAAEYTLGIPVAAVPEGLPPEFHAGELPSTPVYAIRHTGAYRHLGNAWTAGMMRARARVFASNRKIPPFETYETDPRTVREEDTVTIVRFPLK